MKKFLGMPRTNKRGYDKIRYQNNSDKIKLKSRLWRKNNLEKAKLINKTWRKNNPKKIKELKLKKYGITVDQYNEMLVSQNGVCAICLKYETDTDNRSGKIRALAVDHNHITGEVRQLLCGSCNKAIGLLQDNPLLVKNVADYLIKWS